MQEPSLFDKSIHSFARSSLRDVLVLLYVLARSTNCSRRTQLCLALSSSSSSLLWPGPRGELEWLASCLRPCLLEHEPLDNSA